MKDVTNITKQLSTGVDPSVIERPSFQDGGVLNILVFYVSVDRDNFDVKYFYNIHIQLPAGFSCSNKFIILAQAIPRVQLQPRSKTVEKALWMRLVQLYWLVPLFKTYRPPSFMRVPSSSIMKLKSDIQLCYEKTRHTKVSI